MYINEGNGISGELEMVSRIRDTGEVVDHFKDHNIITKSGLDGLVRRLTTANDSDGYVFQFVLGNDVGTGNLFAPEPENDNISEGDQQVIYEVPANRMTFEYPQPGKIRVSTVLKGNEIMNLSQFSGEVDIRYTSASTRFRNGGVFSYKRFPVRALSFYIDISLAWTFTFYANKEGA